MEDNRNIIDYYKYWSTEAVKVDLNTKRNNFSVLVSNKMYDFNLGTLIRNCNAFLAKEILIYGRKQFDKRSTVGTHHYENIKFLREIEELNFNCPVIGIDNIEGSYNLEEYSWPKEHFIIAFGQESIGLTEELKSICKDFVYIRQYGSVRSLNVGTASGIVMHSIAEKIYNNKL